ncbi:MAG: hypothetical protein R2774_08150 [Saprospiraceae bacterium]
MTPFWHKVYINTLNIIVFITVVYLYFYGHDYYSTSLEERFYHDAHQNLKPSGTLGHGFGILGTLMILVGVFGYMARKRSRSLRNLGVLKHWLEFHIFLCTLGPVLVLYHTSFKFGGIVSISFWSMVAVVASGVLGRFIYLQIPRTIQGRELSLHEIQSLKSDAQHQLYDLKIDQSSRQSIVQILAIPAQENLSWFQQFLVEKKYKAQIKNTLLTANVHGAKLKNMMSLVSNELSINRKIQRLVTMQRYFRYWHIAHLPFAIIMLVIMVIHVVVTILFGYTWIF